MSPESHPTPSPLSFNTPPHPPSPVSPHDFSSHSDLSFQDFSFRHTRSFRLGQKNTIHTALGDDDPSTEPFHHVLIAFSNFRLEKKKHSESYIFPLISPTSCPWSISRTKEAPPPLSTLPGSSNTHHTHTQRLHSPSRLYHGAGGFNLHFTVCLQCKKKSPSWKTSSPFNSNKLTNVPLTT